jgi:hypothetical protein
MEQISADIFRHALAVIRHYQAYAVTAVLCPVTRHESVYHNSSAMIGALQGVQEQHGNNLMHFTFHAAELNVLIAPAFHYNFTQARSPAVLQHGIFQALGQFKTANLFAA